MSSLGASYAYAYIQQKRQEQNLKQQIKETKVRIEDGSPSKKAVIDDIKQRRNKKVYPGSFMPTNQRD